MVTIYFDQITSLYCNATTFGINYCPLIILHLVVVPQFMFYFSLIVLYYFAFLVVPYQILLYSLIFYGLQNIKRKIQNIKENDQSFSVFAERHKLCHRSSRKLLFNEHNLNRQILKGEVPSPVNLPKGCLFAPRCPNFENKCSEKLPKPVNMGNNHNAACIKVGTLN